MQATQQHEEKVIRKGQGRQVCTKSKAEQEYVRQEIRAAMAGRGIGMYEVGDLIQVNQSNVSRWLAGKSTLSDVSIETCYDSGIVARPDLSSLQSGAKPAENWTGATKTVAEVALDKGYSAGTVRKYCKDGKLNYTRNGRFILVCLDATYAALEETQAARLRKENATLRAENQQLRRDLQQLQFNFAEAQEDVAELEKEVTAQKECAVKVASDYQKVISHLTKQNEALRPGKKSPPVLPMQRQLDGSYALAGI